MLRWRDRVLPVMDLAKEFQLNPVAAAAPGRKVVIVAVADKQASFLVDKLMGQEEVVIKTLGGFLARVPGVAGGTIMGDGRVALIMDVAALVGQAHAGSVRLAAA